jgi:uncharacterized protein with ParB-like and HNH nuclease domain
MKANAWTLLAIFEKKMRLEVPLFQRQYVWSREDQWEPLWEDIVRKFTEYLEDRKDAPVHFLGAMVLDQKQTPLTHVEKRQVIDGQQRLTTLQIFLSAFRDFCREHSCEELAKECDAFTLNRGMMAEPEVDRFKVWPTLLDRPQFKDVVASGSRAALEEKHPLIRRKYKRYPDPRPRMVEAYIYYYDRLKEFFLGTASEPPIAATHPLAMRLDECFQALKNALQVVVIDLEGGDDAQVIFETLNARGEPLLPADLLRNFIFLRAARQGESQEELYEEYWRRFDDEFWRQEVSQGRLNRPRSDLFMQHFLASRQTTDIPIKHLFVEYKFWIDRKKPYATVRDELAALARQGDDFRRIVEPKRGDILFPLVTFLEAFDIRTAYPLLLHLLDVRMSDGDWKNVSVVLESYLLRRSVCGLSTKNYNRVFLTLTRTLRRDGSSPENLRKYLTELSGESTGWPSDEEFRSAWQERAAYQTLQQPKIVHILRRLSDASLGSKSESISIDSPLTIEHILPQSWIEHWPLLDGSTGMTDDELWDSQATDLRAEATRRRGAALHTFGNLTILTQALNSAVSNSAWKDKRPALLVASLLPINQQLHSFDTWDESTIELRAKTLLSQALKLWPGPGVS